MVFLESGLRTDYYQGAVYFILAGVPSLFPWRRESSVDCALGEIGLLAKKETKDEPIIGSTIEL
jgi:hypothetical protein